jgi:chemotaxis regulatin CheY-phosphate phosphatase CheZ
MLHAPDTWQMMTNDPRALAHLSAADYEAIELAVMETARGRWFLKEFSARNRQADTTVLLDAIARLEGAVSGERAMDQIERVRFDLLEMAKSIAGLKAELEMQENGEAQDSRLGAATSALDGIVLTTEQATSSILSAAEQVQEIAWSLREQQFDEATCDTIDKLATEIYTACGFQDLTAQRTQKVVRTLRFLEGRINALIDAWAGTGESAARPASRPAPDVAPRQLPAIDALSQSDVDFVIVDDPFAAVPTRHDDTIPPNVMSALSMAEALADAHELSAEIVASSEAPEAGRSITDPQADPREELMASDEDPILIDDLDTLDIDLVYLENDVVEDKTAKVPVHRPHVTATTSLAQLDAMPASAKAMIFG